jgi:hypothetical protein
MWEVLIMSYNQNSKKRKARIKDAQNKIGGGSFVMFPKDVLNSHEYLSLTNNAQSLICDFLAAYNGQNNGDLSMSFSDAKRRGWRSSATLRKALVELEEDFFIVKNRQGGRNKICNLYFLTFLAVDECIDKKTGVRKGEFRSTSRPLQWWKKSNHEKAVAEKKKFEDSLKVKKL